MTTRWVSGVVRSHDSDPRSAEEEVAHLAPTGGEERRFFSWRRAIEWALIPVAFIVMRLVPDQPLLRPSGWLLLLLAGALFASPAILASHREHQKTKAVRSAEDLAVEYRLRLGRTLGTAVVPIGDLLGRIVIADPAERVELQAQLRQQVVDAVASLVGASQSRATFFALEGRTLRASAWAGRPDRPASALPRSEPSHDRAYALMEERDRVLVPRVGDSTFALALGGDYQTFLAVTVFCGHKNLGLLCVDAPEPGTLVESDVDIVAALAHMLGPGLAAG